MFTPTLQYLLLVCSVPEELSQHLLQEAVLLRSTFIGHLVVALDVLSKLAQRRERLSDCAISNCVAKIG